MRMMRSVQFKSDSGCRRCVATLTCSNPYGPPLMTGKKVTFGKAAAELIGPLHWCARTVALWQRWRAVTALGVAGALSLAGGASASIATGGIPTQNKRVILA